MEYREIYCKRVQTLIKIAESSADMRLRIENKSLPFDITLVAKTFDREYTRFRLVHVMFERSCVFIVLLNWTYGIFETISFYFIDTIFNGFDAKE